MASRRPARAGTRPDGPGSSARPDHPVVHVSYADAVLFCRWAGERLPGVDEWERAARAGVRTRYPWGDTWDHARANAFRGDFPHGDGRNRARRRVRAEP